MRRFFLAIIVLSLALLAAIYFHVVSAHQDVHVPLF
jgi:hypothetical protein